MNGDDLHKEESAMAPRSAERSRAQTKETKAKNLDGNIFPV